MNKRSYIALLTVFATLGHEQQNKLRSQAHPKHNTQKLEAPLPAGTKRYYFTSQGNCLDFAKGDIIYSTIALSEGRAKDKFAKFLAKLEASKKV
jgi:hypothetical protein